MSERIASGKTVRLAYRVLDAEGRLLEERTPESPAVFRQGEASVLPAIERALEGQGAGYRATLRLAAEDAYGPYDPSLLAEVERASFPQGADVRPGAKFSTIGPGGEALVVRVLEADGDSVSLDGNHPLAGIDLVFELSVLGVGDAEPGGGDSADDDLGDGAGGAAGPGRRGQLH
jgi:FKBP-type peptidyl-prolyl cis-trans isomerase SlyD